MGETILGFLLVGAILIFSALITQGFARTPKGESIAGIAVRKCAPEPIPIKSILTR